MVDRHACSNMETKVARYWRMRYRGRPFMGKTAALWCLGHCGYSSIRSTTSEGGGGGLFKSCLISWKPESNQRKQTASFTIKQAWPVRDRHKLESASAVRQCRQNSGRLRIARPDSFCAVWRRRGGRRRWRCGILQHSMKRFTPLPRGAFLFSVFDFTVTAVTAAPLPHRRYGIVPCQVIKIPLHWWTNYGSCV